jgi:hypothetical protein
MQSEGVSESASESVGAVPLLPAAALQAECVDGGAHAPEDWVTPRMDALKVTREQARNKKRADQRSAAKAKAEDRKAAERRQRQQAKDAALAAVRARTARDV